MTTEEAAEHLFGSEAVAHMKRELKANEERVPVRKSKSSIPK